MRKSFLIAGIILAGLAVGLGAFGAHGLKKQVDAEAIEVFKTGVQYQFYHSLVLIFTAILSVYFSTKHIRRAGVLFLAGIILFSGSLYAITACKAVGTPVPSFIGPVTPLGGVCFIGGWIFLLLGAIQKK